MSRPMNHAHLWLIGGLLLLGMPLTAWANAGTPLMWAGQFHLLLGNFIIGVGEGWLLARIFGRKTRRCCKVMILANYFSAWVGLLLFGFMMSLIQTAVDVNNVHWVFWGLMACAYLITLLLEFPFVSVCFWKDERWFRKTVKATLLVQTASYLLLCIGYMLVSDVSLMRNLRVVDKSTLALPAQATLYYIAEDDSVCYAPLPGGMPVKIGRVQAVADGFPFFLMLGLSDKDPGRCSLMYGEAPVPRSKTTVVEDVCTRAATNVASGENWQDAPGFWGHSLRLGDALNSPWSFRSYFWGAMLGINKDTGEEIVLLMASPLINWRMRNVNHLPGDRLVFQLSDHQICVIDVPTRRIALLATGRSPVVVLDGTPPPALPAGAPLPVISWKESAPQ